jgi:hypothetical protein
VLRAPFTAELHEQFIAACLSRSVALKRLEARRVPDGEGRTVRDDGGWDHGVASTECTVDRGGVDRVGLHGDGRVLEAAYAGGTDRVGGHRVQIVGGMRPIPQDIVVIVVKHGRPVDLNT